MMHRALRQLHENLQRKDEISGKLQRVGGVPLFSHIDINATELCNRKCVFCPRNDPKEYLNQNLHMPLEIAHKIASELRKYKYSGIVEFSGFGEPLLHKDIVGLVRAFGPDIHTEIITNGDRLTVRLAQQLFNAGLKAIIVSLYDGSHQIGHFEELFREAGAAMDQYFLRERWYDESDNYGLLLTNRAGSVHAGTQPRVDRNRPCYYPFYLMQIDWNGDVLLCVHDWKKRVRFGNVEEASLLEIWNSDRFNEYRQMLMGSMRSAEPCRSCNADGTLQGKSHALGWGWPLNGC